MGASNSRLEEDKGLQLCRARKKFIKQALNGRCSLATAHIAYIEQLKVIGAALRQFVEPDNVQVQAFVHPEPHALIDSSVAGSSFSSQTQSRNVDTPANMLLSVSPRVSNRFQSHPMKFGVTISRKIEEKPPEISSFEAHSVPSDGAPPWDYFGLFHPMDDHISGQGRKVIDQGSDFSDEMRHVGEEEGIPDLEDVGEKLSSHETEESYESEDEFDEPSLASLVRSFKNVNTTKDNAINGDSAIGWPGNSDHVNEERSNVVNSNSTVRPLENATPEDKSANDKENSAPDLSPLRAESSGFEHSNNVKIKASEESKVEDKVEPKDLFSNIIDIEQLFVKASESGKEVPRMLEANKFHFRPAFPGKERGSIASPLLKSCFFCGKDPSEIQQDASQNSVKHLTWHRTSSFRSASSRDLLMANSNDDPNRNLFDNFCMVSGSHASTLDRLYAWEKKLCDEVKASQVLKSSFDRKCKLLRQKESQGQPADKTRAAVKNLHSRIRVAIHRINSISKKIEEIRDMELQPQLEELIEGLRKMWEMMMECHKLQYHIISISHTPSSTNTRMQLDSQRQITIHLGHELSSLSSIFTKWINAQKIYVEAIDKWLFKCVSLPQNPSKRNKRMKPPLLRNCGPPIYMICGAWSEMIGELPCEGVADSIKDLAAKVARFLPRQDKNKGKAGKEDMDVLRDEVVEDQAPHLQKSLGGFLGQLNSFAECSLKMFTDLQKAIQDSKTNYEHFTLQRSQVFI